jgi:serine/threonine protein phosphatase PrpC
MKLVAGASSDVGRLRERNEDSFLVDDRLTLYAVADGMGGHRGGAVASSTSLEALRAAVASGDEIAQAIKRANTAVFEAASSDESLAGMGTTLTAVVAVSETSVLIGHVGDSRAYLARGGAITQLTDDHSLVEELVREGRLTRDQAEVHPQRSIITRALGVEPDIDVDLYAVTVAAGDRILLCSDGLTTMLRDRDIEQILRTEPDPRLAADKLVDAANAAGGEDNITVLVVDVLEVDDRAAPADAFTTLVTPTAAGAAPVTPVATPPVEEEPPADVFVGARRGRGRRIAALALVAVPVLAVIAVAVGAVGWYARRSYFVGLDGDEVVLYQGVPGGVLGWDPTVAERSDLTVADLTQIDAAALEDGAGRGSRDKAEAYLALLEERVEARQAATSTTTSTTTTSTVPPTTRAAGQRSSTTTASRPPPTRDVPGTTTGR